MEIWLPLLKLTACQIPLPFLFTSKDEQHGHFWGCYGMFTCRGDGWYSQTWVWFIWSANHCQWYTFRMFTGETGVDHYSVASSDFGLHYTYDKHSCSLNHHHIWVWLSEVHLSAYMLTKSKLFSEVLTFYVFPLLTFTLEVHLASLWCFPPCWEPKLKWSRADWYLLSFLVRWSQFWVPKNPPFWTLNCWITLQSIPTLPTILNWFLTVPPPAKHSHQKIHETWTHPPPLPPFSGPSFTEKRRKTNDLPWLVRWFWSTATGDSPWFLLIPMDQPRRCSWGNHG